MPFGTNDAAITTNDLIKAFETQLVPRVEELDAFGPFFAEMRKPANVEKTINFEIDSTGDTAIAQAPESRRVSRKRSAYELEVVIHDKFRDSRILSWEKVRKGRIDEVQASILNGAQALAKARNAYLGSFLLSQSIQVGSGTTEGSIVTTTPQAPSLPATGQTPYWWNASDTVAPAPYGSHTFSVGHNHIESAGATALSLDRIRFYMQHILEHGYARSGFVMMLQTQEEATLLKLANVVQQNQTLGIKLRDDFQKVGRASAVNGLMGIEVIQSEWVPPGVVGLWDNGLAGLPSGGALKVVEVAPTQDPEDVKEIQATVLDTWEQFGAGVLHKAAGYTARVA